MRGAFTGAVQDRIGWLEECPAGGTVFLDEIGELDPAIQVKLLRVFHARTFQRLGETRERRFEGKIMAATNRDLAREIEAGRFREDFYYRLCADSIVTPSLAEQLADAPGELRNLALYITRRIAGEEHAEALADQVTEWVQGHLGADYAWPGNIRELEQCARSIMIRRRYEPLTVRARAGRAELARAVCAGELSAEELLRRYCTLLYARTGSYREAARRLGVDWRTVKDKTDPELVEVYRES